MRHAPHIFVMNYLEGSPMKVGHHRLGVRASWLGLGLGLGLRSLECQQTDGSS